MITSSDHLIPTSFTMPLSYREVYVLHGYNGAVEIRRWSRKKLMMKNTGWLNSVESSMCLDWIQETVEQIRYDCDNTP